MSTHGRRGFLGLLGLFGLAPVLPSVARAYPKPAKYQRPLSFTAMTREVAREMEAALSGYATTHREVARAVPEEYHVSIEPVDPKISIEEWRSRYAVPIGGTLAATIRSKGLRILTDLPMPSAGAEACRVFSKVSGLSVRGVRQHDITRDRDLVRFDIAGERA